MTIENSRECKRQWSGHGMKGAEQMFNGACISNIEHQHK